MTKFKDDVFIEDTEKKKYVGIFGGQLVGISQLYSTCKNTQIWVIKNILS
jgi:acyl-CoA thioesterase